MLCCTCTVCDIILWCTFTLSTGIPRTLLVESDASKLLPVLIHFVFLSVSFRDLPFFVRMYFIQGDLLSSHSCLHPQATQVQMPRSPSPCLPHDLNGRIDVHVQLHGIETDSLLSMHAFRFHGLFCQHAAYRSASLELSAMTVWSLLQLRSKC